METKAPEGQAESPQEAAAPTKEGGGKPMGMGMGMMKKMMGQMGQGGGGPMAMMQKMMGQKGEGTESGGNLMQQRMGTCMAMCTEMLDTMRRTTSLAVYAQPELYQLFEEWLAAREGDVLKLIEERGNQDTKALAAALSMSPASVTTLLAHLQNQGKIRLRAEIVEKS
ncbi:MULTISPECIES: MarR family transcriptional regulator [Acidithiobacillus]|jgi:DNA-binding CsgD family transcriptional regulator|uniref:HTH marR-type domain-containing protein n=2 Tax=Acidithiobacillus TaxID=119977 RepID=A0A179BK31_ACIFR|nr:MULTISPECIES: MarR family transcriptional regulator [Acidithiobacillus]MEB8486979.1 MarR family transcriptional regulator [Acidithiobacillus ferriphilus]MEB8491286.1 MarR family transcriptional regulator [Acidithiobacillus ferriphilus]MEB8494596.1 MarR family transcriptional regulator [Acidithiobacillus ferriphilus]MEB8512490.1 MarR family transcriptional regulator [Acidithiobacillus ferriphilus]MEB8520429.1 MarR family transcriptional regulator [Acidithiobacillus ferriphilus]